MRRARRHVAGTAAGLLLLTACTGNEPEPDPPPIGGEYGEDPNDEASEEDDEDPYAAPDEIDEAYAEKVINALLETNTEALKIILQQDPGNVIDPQAADRLAAISTGRRLETALETFQVYIDQPESRDAFLPLDDIGSSRFESYGILHAEPQVCILAVGWWDLTEVVVEPPKDPSLFSLSPVDREVTASERNPTPWQIREISEMMRVGGEPVPEGRWDEIDFGDELDRTCEHR